MFGVWGYAVRVWSLGFVVWGCVALNQRSDLTH